MGSEILKPVKQDCKIRLTFQGAGSDIVVLWFFGRGSYFLMLFSGVMGIRKRDKTRKNTISWLLRAVYIRSDQIPKPEICLDTQYKI